MISSYRVCVVGAGHWGENHIRTLSELGVLGGVVESNSEVLNFLNLTYPKIHCFSNLESAFTQGFDGFTVATPAETHFDIARKIIENGHHVLVEKPITMNSNDALCLHELSTLDSLIDFKIRLVVGSLVLASLE